MDKNQNIKNRLGTTYISLMILIAVLALFINGITFIDIVDILLVLTLFILLQKNTINLKTLCILSIIVGTILFMSCKGIAFIMSIWLIIYSIISLTKIKNGTDI